MTAPTDRSDADHYARLGVSARKTDVKNAIRDIDPGLFPRAFCKAVPDHLTGSPDHCLLAHSDGAGTKSILAYLHYRRHGDAGIFRGIAQDSLVMNLDDLLCVGAIGPFLFSNTIGRNAKRVPGEVVRAVIHGYEEFAERMHDLGIELVSCGGETADLGDLVRTIIVDSSVTVRMPRSEFVDCSRVRPGHVIVGLASSGRATYEAAENSGVGTNGLTALRHGLLAPRYRSEFEETFAPEIAEAAYAGPYELDDRPPGLRMTVAEACLSPTRTYAPIVVEALKAHRSSISAMFHNTGGGQLKCLGFGGKVRYVKDNLLPLPPLFDLVRRTGAIAPREMLQIFNMGHRFEIVCDGSAAADIIAISQSFEVHAQIVGRVEDAARRSLGISWEGELLEFAA